MSQISENKELSIEEVLEELCMITGQVSTDMTYLYYLLVKDGPIVKQYEEKYSIRNENTVDTLEDWFAKMEGMSNEI